ncbi:TonB-dependent receptor [Paraglaciecola aquimarina]|uniref:TonB-dependent receptor n=1 Tax=Paraglaciecola aquimarina TaxID=1235557 RepID=A0ABU3SV54_9ALTE|nr:TonB-dependent receptor [Paraglaciecola aquimarina]MDU0353905.1 TonB-dependent receptor [Paraglaciecola aquimarina]
MNTFKKLSKLSLAVSISLAASNSFAQEEESDTLGFEQIIVTGTPQATTKMKSSVSVSTVVAGDIQVATPRTTAEIFRTIPGIRSESTGGDGNANIAVRGLPVAAGGAKFLQLQEDGLPIVQFGDIAFGNADIFLRADSTVESIQAIRGGSASTTASNAPGGIINFLSKTGESEGGSVSATFGVDYDSLRTDFEYGSELADDLRFHVGGFVREGEGARDTGYSGQSGGQIKANITKDLDNGYVRLYFKHLDDKSTGYLPMPMYADGSSIPGFDAQQDTPHSVYLLNMTRLDGDNNISRSDLRDGMNPVVNALGFEAVVELSDDWTFENRFRISDISGSFVSLFPAEVVSADAMAASFGEGSSLSYANGPMAGQAFTSSANGNGLAMRIHTFDVDLNDMGSLVNDMKLTRNFDNISVSAGYYKARQEISMSWLWNSYLMEVKGDNAALLNVSDADGNSLSDNGLYAYGTPVWGNCCQRNYDLTYNITAPYVAVSADLGDLTFDASFRRDQGDAVGTYAGAVTQTLDMNGDGVISVPEQSVAGIDNANPSVANYDWSYNSYSVGANYSFDRDNSVFARLSRGGRANADRLAFGKIAADGSVSKEDTIDLVDQIEIGYKYRQKDLGIFVTAFMAETEEQNFEATSQKFFDRVYEASGVEVEFAYDIDALSFQGGFTWTDAEITQDAVTPEVVGNTPRRQADLIYTLTSTYKLDEATVGVNLIGTTGAYAQDSNELKFDAYTQVNAFAQYFITDDFTVSLNVNNLFDVVGITEAEEGAASPTDVIRARTINGRTTSVNLRYNF